MTTNDYLVCDLLTALQPWELHGPSVRSAAARITLALAAVPYTEHGKQTTKQGGTMSAQQAQEAVREALVKLLASEDGHIQVSAARLLCEMEWNAK